MLGSAKDFAPVKIFCAPAPRLIFRGLRPCFGRFSRVGAQNLLTLGGSVCGAASGNKARRCAVSGRLAELARKLRRLGSSPRWNANEPGGDAGMKEQRRFGSCPFCKEDHCPDYRCTAEFEAWEIDHELQMKQDYAALIAFYEAAVEWRGDGLHGAHQLGEAYLLNGEPEKAIELLTEAHREHPWNEEFQRVILASLFALGKDETDFDWVERIPVYRLGTVVLERCHASLRSKRKLQSVFDLYDEIELDGYCAFDPAELLEAIRGDDRVVVVDEEEFWTPGIRARRRHDRREEARSRERGVAVC